MRVDLIVPDGSPAPSLSRTKAASIAVLELPESDDSGGLAQIGIDQGIGHEGQPVMGFTFCVRADDVGDAATLGVETAQRAGSAVGVGPAFYDVVVVPHSALVVTLDQLDIPMPD